MADSLPGQMKFTAPGFVSGTGTVSPAYKCARNPANGVMAVTDRGVWKLAVAEHVIPGLENACLNNMLFPGITPDVYRPSLKHTGVIR